MKKTIVAMLLVGSLGSVYAADLPSRKAPILPPPLPAFTWSGFYVGLNAGATFGNRNGFTVVGAPVATNAAAIPAGVLPIQNAIDAALTGVGGTGSRTGAILGAQAGYNYQFASPVVLGFETDIQGVLQSQQRGLYSNIAPISGAFPPFSVQTIGAVQKRVDYLGTARARIGYSFTPTFIVYATGGLAYAGVKSSTVTSVAIQPAGALAGTLPISGSFAGLSKTRAGYTVGAGVEWMFMPNFSLKAEYLYYDLGSVSYNGISNFSQPGGFGFLSQDVARTRVRFDGHIARVGVNYHFWGPPAAPVVARY